MLLVQCVAVAGEERDESFVCRESQVVVADAFVDVGWIAIPYWNVRGLPNAQAVWFGHGGVASRLFRPLSVRMK